MYGHYSVALYLLYVTDCILIASLIAFGIKFASLMNNMVVVNFGASIIYNKQINSELNEYNCKFSQMPLWLFLYRIRRFLRNHWLRAQYLHYTNGKVMSTTLFSTVLTQLPVNVYLVAQVLYTKKDNFMFLMMITLLFVQMLIVIQSFNPLALVSKTLRSSHKQFVTTQRLLPKCSIPLKLKWNMHYEIIHTKRKQLAYTAGPLGKITISSLFQVRISKFSNHLPTMFASCQGFSAYIGLLFYSLRMVRSLYQTDVGK